MLAERQFYVIMTKATLYQMLPLFINILADKVSLLFMCITKCLNSVSKCTASFDLCLKVRSKSKRILYSNKFSGALFQINCVLHPPTIILPPPVAVDMSTIHFFLLTLSLYGPCF